MMARIDRCGAQTIVSTNTSGIPIHQIADGRSGLSAALPGHPLFQSSPLPEAAGNHPHEKQPRIGGVHERVRDPVLGKGVVICKDTPNFVANRMISIAGSHGFTYALDRGTPLRRWTPSPDPPSAAQDRHIPPERPGGHDVMEHVGPISTCHSS